jgi:hypothetical protein
MLLWGIFFKYFDRLQIYLMQEVARNDPCMVCRSGWVYMFSVVEEALIKVLESQDSASS